MLRFGYELGILSESDVVEAELRRMKDGLDLTNQETQLASLLSDELDKVPDLLGPAETDPLPFDPARVWAYVGVMLLRARWTENRDAVYELAGLIESLGTPEPYRELVYYEKPDKRLRGRGSPGRFLETIDERLKIDAKELSPVSSEI